MPTNDISNNQISLLVYAAFKDNFNYFIFDESGRILQTNNLKFQKGSQQHIININANLPKEVYFLKLLIENTKAPFVFKMIK